MFSRENRRPKTAKVKIYLSFGGCRAAVVALSLWGGGGVHWVQVSGLSGLSAPLVVCSLLLSLLFVPLLLLLSCNTCKICPISHFKGVLTGFWGSDVYLYGLRSLRGLCGFCVREWLGGLKACGVFA